MTLENPPSAESDDGNQETRKRRLTYALTTGVISKLLAVAVQGLALPLALKSLGTDRYAAFLALQALVAWSGLLALGLTPSLPRFISHAFIAKNQILQRDIFQTVIIYLGTACALFASFMLMLGQFVPPAKMVATHGVPAGQILSAYQAVIIVTSFQLLGSVMPSIRGGYQELHYSYTWACLASVMVITILHQAAADSLSISTFLIAIYGPLALLMLIDMIWIVIQRPYLLRGRAPLLQTGRLLAPQAGNALAAQFSYFLVSFLPTLVVAHLANAQATASFGSVMQILVLLGSGMNLIYQPLVPAIANAYAHQDRAWVRVAYFRAAKLVGLICCVGLVAAIYLGHALLQAWLGPNLIIPRMLPTIMGVYFTIWTVNIMHFNILAATGNLSRVGWAYLIEGSFSVGLGAALTPFMGANGMALGLVIGAASVNFWFLSIQVWRHVINSAAQRGVPSTTS